MKLIFLNPGVKSSIIVLRFTAFLSSLLLFYQVAFGVGEKTPMVKKEFTYRLYTVSDGLAQMQVMGLYQDSQGYLWASTKAGLSRFDGHNFRYFSHDLDVTGFDLPVLGEDAKGNFLLFGPKEYLILDADTFRVCSYPPQIDSWSRSVNAPRLHLKEVDFIDAKGERIPKVLDYSNADLPVVLNLNSNYGRVVLFDEHQPGIIWQATSDSLFRVRLEAQQVIERIVTPAPITKLFRQAESYVAITADFSVYRFQNGLFEKWVQLNECTTSMKAVTIPGEDVLILATDQNLYRLGNTLDTIKSNLTQIRELVFDAENNLWVASEEGLYNFFQLNFVNYSFGMGNKDWVWSVVEDADSNIWFASYQNGLWKWDGRKVIDYTSQLNTKLAHHIKESPIPDRYRYYMGASRIGELVYFPTECNVLKYEKGNFSPLEGLPELPFQITRPLPDSSLVCAGYAGLFRVYPSGKVEAWHRDSVGVSSILSVEQVAKDQLLAVGKYGAALVDKYRIEHFHNAFLQGSYTTARDHRGNVWIAGINRVNLFEEHHFIPVYKKNEEAFYSLLFYPPHYLFLGGIKGLYLVDLERYYREGEFEPTFFGRNSGFTGLECGQNGFYVDSQGMVWIPTSDVVVQFDPEKLIHKKIIPPRLKLAAAVSSDKINWYPIPVSKPMQIPFSENSLRFALDIVSYSNIGNIRLYTRLEGLQNDWSAPLTNTEVTFYNLLPGKYCFWVKADPGISTAASEPLTFEFKVEKPWVFRPWVLVLELLLLAALVYGIVVYFQIKEKKRQAIKHRLTQLRSEALAAQLDPHFVMNCLNNISGLINAGRKEAANEYIVKFSRLLRSILQSVKKDVIPLDEELEMVRGYLVLEQFRCDYCFDFEIKLSTGIVASRVLVPPMLLQPLVENSVKHGFGREKRLGARIEIGVHLDGKFLHFSVRDNGRGMNNTSAFKSTGIGTRITRERIELLQRKNNIEFEIRNREPGVEVTFKIPLIKRNIED